MSKFSKFLHKMHDVTQAGGSIRDMVILSPGMTIIRRMTKDCRKCKYFAGGLLVCAPHPYGVDPGCDQCPDFEERDG